MNPAFSRLAGSLAAAAWLTTGCGSTSVNTLEPAEPTAQRAMVSDQRVLADRSLASSVRVVGVNTATDAAGFLKVQLETYNPSRKRKLFTYRVEWFDAQGMVINLPTATSIPMSLEARETKFITATAPTPQAKDFRFRFLEPVN
ncbi:MAG: YcfL family protein [Verrucomicrobiales bacterium]|nr:YcfL family protein [Verrucomicrobiales bacterium]